MLFLKDGQITVKGLQYLSALYSTLENIGANNMSLVQEKNQSGMPSMRKYMKASFN